MNTQDKSSSRNRLKTIGKSALDNALPRNPQKISFFRRLDIRFPWLKLVFVVVLGVIAIADLCDLTISRANNYVIMARIAPMQKHVKIAERNLKGKKLVVLTFDDGPSSTTTPVLLDTLKKRDVPAVFFMLGNMARNNPDLVREVEKNGHEVASHTMYHQNLTSIPLSSATADINEAKSTLNSILGHDPSYTRPPYGNNNDAIRSAMGTPVILWSVDTLDWKYKNTESIVSIALSQVHDGAVILMHDIHPTSVEAVPVLIDELRKAGYEFVTIKELAEIKGIKLSAGGLYRNIVP